MKKLFYSLLIGLSPFCSTAQDAHLSLYDAAPLYLNPAMTGVFQGNWRSHGQYRTQWKAVNYKPYNMGLISFDMPLKKWGIGLQVSNFRAGIGNYNAFQGLLSLAYTTSVDKSRDHNISFGIQGGLTQKSVEYQLLSFNNQYTTNNGGEFDMTLATNEDFSGQSLIVPNLNAGFLYFFARQQSRLNPFLGISAFNLTQPKESLTGLDNRLPMRFYGHVGTRINVTETFYLIPKVLIMQQENFMEQTYAVDFGYYMKGSDTYLLGGIVFRSKDAMIASLGARMNRFVVKLGYDFNVSTLSTASTGRGGFELSLTYIHQKKQLISDKICPRL